MPSSWLVFDRLRAYISGSGVYRHENILQDQPSLDALSSSGPERSGLQSAIIQSIQVNYFRRTRYVDYDKMDEMGEISLALDMYADESCVVNSETGHIVQVYGESTRVKHEVQDLFNKTLMIDHQCRAMVRYLCKYGDCAFRLILSKTRDEVVGLKRLDVYNFTRIETSSGDLVAFHYTDPELNQSYFMHPWEVVHFRLTNFEARYHPYGKSIIEGGRKAYKQLTLMESSAVIYRLCLTGDSMILTDKGDKRIDQISIGDMVYCYTPDRELVLTPVIEWVNNGKQDVYRVKTSNRHLDATVTHPFLTWNSETHHTEYVDVRDLKPGEHWLVTPWTHNQTGSSLPDGSVANADFMWWLGYMLSNAIMSSDGIITIVTPNRLPINEALLSALPGAKLMEEQDGGFRQIIITDQKECARLEMLGCIGNPATRTLPQWLYGLRFDLARQFITGILETAHTASPIGYTVDLCNASLIEDLVKFCDWCNLTTKRSKEFNLIISIRQKQTIEMVQSVEQLDEQQEVFDISVEHDVHNFVANGMVVHNTRAPQKRKFTIPVGNIPSSEVPEYLRKIAAGFKSKRFYNPANGQFDERYAPLTQEDDFFLPVRPDGSGPNIETLQGADNLGQIEDIEYFLKKLIAPTKIPPSRLGIGDKTGGDSDGKPLSQTSSDFAKNVGWVQQVMSVGFTKIALVHLALKGFSRDEMNSFWTTMMVTSAMEELYRIETWQTRVNIMADLQELGWFPKEWILSHFTDLSPDEIEQMILKGNADMGDSAAPELGGMGGGGGGGMGGPEGDMGDMPDFGGEGDEGGMDDLGDDFGGDDLGGEGDEGDSADDPLLNALEDDSLFGESFDDRLISLERKHADVVKKDAICEQLNNLRKLINLGKKRRDNSIATAIIESNELLGVPVDRAESHKTTLMVEGVDEINSENIFEYYIPNGNSQKLYGEIPDPDDILEAAMHTIKHEQYLLDTDRNNTIMALESDNATDAITEDDVNSAAYGG